MVGVAAVALACGGTTNPGDAGGNDAAGDVVDMDAIGVFYGAPPLDASPNDASKSDAAPADATTDQDAGGIALYGAPPPLDSGEG